MSIQSSSQVTSIICTIPRSGTNLIEYFMRYLGYFMFIADIDVGDEENLFNSIKLNKNTHRNLFPKVGHGYCPGYRRLENNIWYQKWSQIPESDNWFNVLRKYVEKDDSFNVDLNANARIVFVYRNIYDCILSLYDHLENHKNYKLADKSLNDFAMSIVPQFVKSYVSFREMQSVYPDNILMIKYDDLIQSRRELILKICEFCKISKSYSSSNFEEAFDKAYHYTEISEMKRLEQFMGNTLAGDQKYYNSANSHIRSIDRKSQRKDISPELLSRINLMLAEYDIDEFSFF